jgi:hypothetical protein
VRVVVRQLATADSTPDSGYGAGRPPAEFAARGLHQRADGWTGPALRADVPAPKRSTERLRAGAPAVPKRRMSSGSAERAESPGATARNGSAPLLQRSIVPRERNSRIVARDANTEPHSNFRLRRDWGGGKLTLVPLARSTAPKRGAPLPKKPRRTAKPGVVDALELPRATPTGCRMINLVWPKGLTAASPNGQSKCR